MEQTKNNNRKFDTESSWSFTDKINPSFKKLMVELLCKKEGKDGETNTGDKESDMR